MILDKWQQEVVDYQGSILVRAGRQVGKSTAVGIKAAKFILSHKNVNVLMIGAAQRQSFLLFEKSKAEEEKNPARSWTARLNVISIVSFILGVIFLALFVIINLSK